MVKLFVEGGGDGDSLKTECRRAFTQLLERAGLGGRLPRLVACGGRQNAFEQFWTATAEGGQTDLVFLLVDAEEPVTCASPWDHVARQRGEAWARPAGVKDDHLHLMVQCMEAWFVADRPALRKFFGQGFNENALPPATAKIEEVSKLDLYRKLEQATRGTKTKGIYGKGPHSFKLLATLEPSRIRQASPWAERFFATLDRLTK
jgi:Domain of unknown function (DUF4276)